MIAKINRKTQNTPIIIQPHNGILTEISSEPSKAETSRPQGRVKTITRVKVRRRIAVRPAIRQSISSGNAGKRNISMRTNIWREETVLRYFSTTFFPKIRSTKGLPKALPIRKAQIDPITIANKDNKKPRQKPNSIPPIKVVRFPGIGEIITCINCRAIKTSGAQFPKELI